MARTGRTYRQRKSTSKSAEYMSMFTNVFAHSTKQRKSPTLPEASTRKSRGKYIPMLAYVGPKRKTEGVRKVVKKGLQLLRGVTEAFYRQFVRPNA